ncbi:FG-GAP-like repeat-containing protein, partial [Myxococcota bacterium]|nr:FG-GAP-like repeat-containing protein [Myxococcota bacterium]
TDPIDDDTAPADDDVADDDSLPSDDDTVIPDDDTASDDDSVPADDDTAPVDADVDGYDTLSDCDDGDASVHPGAAESCDGRDEDCDGLVDEDFDGDGDGHTTCGGDCDDADAAIHPGAAEVCNGVDDDCAGGDDCPLEGVIDLAYAGATIRGPSGMGDSLAGAGDVNGDGYDDILLGHAFSGSGSVAYLFFGPVHGAVDETMADVTFTEEGVSSNGTFAAVAVGGSDLNGDGYDDVALTHAPYDEWQAGQVFAYFGPLSGTVRADEADALLEGTDPFNHPQFAYDIALVPDVTGDGLADVWLIALGTYEAFLFTGPLGWRLDRTDAVGWVVPGADGMLGHYTAGGADLDGDGAGDLVLSNNTRGVKLFDGDLVGEATGDSAWATILADDPYGAGNSLPIASPGDVDGDGTADLLVGDKGYTDAEYSEGALYLFRGPPSGTYSLTDADMKVVGDAEFGYLGHDVSGAGDVDGDGLRDFIVGAYNYPAAPGLDGAVFLFYGPGLAGEHNAGDADARLDCPPDSQHAGWAVAAAGDVNADGYDDFMTTAFGVPEIPGEATVYVVYGRPR